MMIPQIKKILYASDLSEQSMPALAWAMMLAHRHDAHVTFLHVIEMASAHAIQATRSFMGEDKWKEMTEGRRSGATEEIKDRIERFCDHVNNEMAACPMMAKDIVIKSGVPVEDILEESAARDVDLIVMGTHGAGLFKDAMIGSTARRVLRRSKIPVIVIPLPGKES